MFAAWAGDLRGLDAPIIADITPRTIPASGDKTVTVSGINLDTVTGINFGPSTERHGLGGEASCIDTQCTSVAPPGTGTVHVTAVSPAGPSEASDADLLTYTPETTPTVTSVFPGLGGLDGGTNVTVYGSGLTGGHVYFGPASADFWNCSDTSCSATSPAQPARRHGRRPRREHGGGLDDHRGRPLAYLSTLPPPPGVPTITSVSPATALISAATP